MIQGMDYITSLPKRSLGLAGRVTYGYDNRYLLEANVGFNGSENFAKGNRMGIFPEYLLSFERCPFHAETPDHYALVSYLLDLLVSQSSALMPLHSETGYQSV